MYSVWKVERDWSLVEVNQAIISLVCYFSRVMDNSSSKSSPMETGRRVFIFIRDFMFSIGDFFFFFYWIKSTIYIGFLLNGYLTFNGGY